MRDAPLLDTQVSSTFTELNVRQDTGKPHFVRLHDSVVRDLERQLQGGREQSGILIGSVEGSGPFTIAVEKNCGITGRVLWSESEENLAQKLISRLQKVQ